jgi:TM2 domain-containing membrane protein YozV
MWYTSRRPMNIYCPNCENECSVAARACPKCGHPLVAPPLSPRIEPPVARPSPQPPPQIVYAESPAPASHRKWSPGIAAVLSFFIPGLGQLYKGQPINGLFWFGCVVVGYVFFLVPGMALHLCCVLGSLTGDPYQ